MPNDGVRCPACFGEGIIDLRDQNALLAEHLDDTQMRHLRRTAAWQQPVRPCGECDGSGRVVAARAEALRRMAYSAVEKALQAIESSESPKEGI